MLDELESYFQLQGGFGSASDNIFLQNVVKQSLTTPAQRAVIDTMHRRFIRRA